MKRKYLVGMLCGWLFWVVLLAITEALTHNPSLLPRLIRDSEVFKYFFNAAAIAALPIGIGGWFFVWGDNGPPAWADGWTIHIVAGLALYGAIGAMAAPHWAAFASLSRQAMRAVKRCVNKRDLAWIVVVAAVFAGWMVDRNKLNREEQQVRFQRAVKAVAMEKAKMDAARAELEGKTTAE
jgi:hypothetical protein